MPTNKATGTKINNGGSAFPMIQPALDPRASGFFAGDGMTLRDWFAGMAMQGILASYSNIERMKIAAENWKKTGEETFEEYLSIMSYQQADAMLAERERDTK